MENKIDIRYKLTSFLNGEIQKQPDFQYIKGVIERDGYSIIETKTYTVKIYRPELSILFISESFLAFNLETQTEEPLRIYDYLLSYIDGYKEGEEYFENEFKVSPNTLYGANAEQYVRDIHLNYFHAQIKGFNEGWGYVKKTCPTILTHKTIREFGYYSGLVNKVWEQVNKHPRLFATFDKCDHVIQPQQIEKKAEQGTIEMKPAFNTEAVQIVFDILKDFFSKEQQNELKQVLETGNNAAEHLIFLDNGNRLADAFKQLKKADIITGCKQQELENWIYKNFKYRYRKMIKEYSTRYLNDIISTNKDKCQNPLLNVKKDKTTGELIITKA